MSTTKSKKRLTQSTSSTHSKNHSASPNGSASDDPAVRSAEALQKSLEARDQEIIDIPIALLVRHPDNRRPTQPAVLALMDSLVDHGQIEPCLVRPLKTSRAGPHERYQMLSGETRWLAAQRLQSKTIRARLLELDDAAALRLVALANARRTDLNPIERAQLLKRLTDPIAAGGAGLTQQRAADDVGLSRAAVANEVRLLRLPPEIQDDIATGRLPATFARELIPLADGPAKSLLPKLYNSLAKDFLTKTQAKKKSKKPPKDETADTADSPKDETASTRFDDVTTREEFVDLFLGRLARHTRSMAPAGQHCRTNEYSLNHATDSHQPALFSPTEEQLARLQVVEFDGERRALNVKLWTDLQRWAAAELLSQLKQKRKSAAQKADGAAGKSKSKSKEVTPAQAKARAEEDARQLAHKVSKFRDNWLSHLIADAIEAGPSKAPDKLAHLETVERLVLHLAHFGIDLGTAFEQVSGKPLDVSCIWQSLKRLDGDQLDRLFAGVVACELRDMYQMKSAELADIAKTLGIKPAEAWRKNRAGILTERFFELFNADQLRQLAVEWKILVGYAAPADELRQTLARDKRSLVLPKCLK